MSARPAADNDRLSIHSRAIAIELSRDGEIVRATFGARKKDRLAVLGHTQLEGWRTRGEVERRALDGGGFEFTRTLADFMPGGVAASQHRECMLVDRFTPTENSIRWEIKACSEERSCWTTAIQTHLVWPEPALWKLWTAWDDSRYGEPFLDKDTVDKSWRDPLEPVRFKHMRLDYGGHYWFGGGFSIPIATVVSEAEEAGISLVLSPEDDLLHLKLLVDERGSIIFSRLDHRMGQGKTVRFSMDLVGHAADWRCGLSWMVDRYPAIFDPPNPEAHEISGCGAYSVYRGDFDTPVQLRIDHSTGGGQSFYEGEISADKYRRMSFRVNWQSSFEFPYMGLFLPPVDDGEEWISFRGERTSFRTINDYCQRMRENGFHVLCYFNVAEFGCRILYPAPPRKANADVDVCKDANDLLYSRFADALLLGPDGRPIWSWEESVGMDFGEPCYLEFLLEQAARQLEKVPAASGICIDRLDWLAFSNDRRDDGVSWALGKPARSLLVSWKALMEKLGPLMHDKGKVIYVNPHFRRIEIMRHVDGIFDEFTHVGFSINACGFLGLRKPVLGWTSSVEDLRPDPDAFFQRYLHMGVFPMAPFPGNDHSIQPDEWAERYYLDYGPLLDAMRGKRWVLHPHAVNVAGQRAKANMFQVADGFTIPVTFGSTFDLVRLYVRAARDLAEAERPLDWEALHPGRDPPLSLVAAREGDAFTLDVPLRRGCAVVRGRFQQSAEP